MLGRGALIPERAGAVADEERRDPESENEEHAAVVAGEPAAQ
jgi:hypothetical protein